MDIMKKFLNLYVPVTTCNFKCPYCYITLEKKWKDKLPEFNYSAEHIAKALSKERLGGTCHINLCGGGETLLPPQMTNIIHKLLKEGHYIMIVTNGTITKRFNEILNFDKKYLKRLGFKFSFHYLELKRTKMMDQFLNNVNNVKDAGCSYSIEMTPYDELIPYIDEIKEFCMDNFGAYCHVTVARNSEDPKLPILTNYSREEYEKIWGSFNSALFEFKLSTFNKKREEFCYAGEWSYWINIGNGKANQCYQSRYSINIFENLDKPIPFNAIGKDCRCEHCHNSHALIGLGAIPEIESPTYAMMRDRKTDNGYWLNDDMRNFLSQKLYETNDVYTEKKKKSVKYNNYSRQLIYRLKRIITTPNKDK